MVCSNFVSNRPLENVQNELNNERMQSLSSIDGSLLNNIDKLIAVADPCDLSMWRKQQNPSHAVVCSGAEELEKYAELMDIIFSVKYIERAFELKTIIDHTLLRLHPHIITVSSDKAFESD